MRARAARRSRSRPASDGIATRGAASRTSPSATGCSGSPSSMPRRSESAGTEARACSALGCWSSRPHPQCLRRPLLTAASLCSRSCRARRLSQSSHGARDPRARAVGDGADHGALAARAATSPRPRRPRPRTRRSAGCRDRGSPSHDGLAARLVDYRQDEGGISIELQPLRWALRLVAGRRLAQPCRALRHARRRRTLARWAPRPVGVLLGRALGAGRRRRRRPRREPGRHARPRAARRSGRSRPSASGRGAAAPAPPAGDVRRPGVARRGRRGAGDARPRARRLRLVARATSTTGRPRPGRRCRGWPAGWRCEQRPPRGRRAAHLHPAEVDLSFTHSCVYLALLLCAFALGKPAARDVRPRPQPRPALDLHVARLPGGGAAARRLAAPGRRRGRARRDRAVLRQLRVRPRADGLWKPPASA